MMNNIDPNKILVSDWWDLMKTNLEKQVPDNEIAVALQLFK